MRRRTNTASSIRSTASATDARGRSISPPQAVRNRSRLNSKDIPRTYSGLYGTGGGAELIHDTTPTSDLLPFELSRNLNTDWLIPRMGMKVTMVQRRRPRRRQRGGGGNVGGGGGGGKSWSRTSRSPKSGSRSARKGRRRPATVPSTSSGMSLLCIYIFFIVLLQLTIMLMPYIYIHVSYYVSFTITNVIHGMVTMLFLHWIKGSPNFYEQGEMNAMTTWEQLNCLPDMGYGYEYEDEYECEDEYEYDDCVVDHDHANDCKNDGDDNDYEYVTTYIRHGEMIDNTKKVLIAVPTLLCYIACHSSNYDWGLCAVNLSVWAVCVIAKLEGMNGVRIWGINRTIGIDDDMRKVD